MQAIILFIHIILAVTLIGLILLQQGKGAQMGAAFGSGASNTLFGSRGPAGFLLKLTSTLIALFFITSVLLGVLTAREAKSRGEIVAPITHHQKMDSSDAMLPPTTKTDTTEQTPVKSTTPEIAKK